MKLPTASYGLPGRNASRLVNCYAQQSMGKTPVEVVGFPGIASVASLGGAGRGLAVMGNTLFAVAGNTLYDALSGYSHGSVPGAGKLTFAIGEGYFATDNGVYYDGTLSTITDPDKVATSSVDYIDGFMVGVEVNSGRFVSSDLRDFTSWDGLEYATAEGAPDDLVRLIVDHRQIVLIGTQSVEIWWNAGNAGFPFERVASGFLEIGGLAKLGVTKADNSVFWLASDRTIRRLSGSTPVKVSQIGVGEAITSYATVSDCIAFSFTWNEQIHVWFRFPMENKSWVLNVATSEWWESDLALIDAAHFNGHVYVQHADGRIGRLTNAVSDRFGVTAEWLLRFPSIYNGNARAFFSQVDFPMRTGDVPAGVVPKATLRVSHDGGNLFHTLPVKEYGRTGEYDHVLRWTRLGSGRDTVFELSGSGPLHLQDAPVLVTVGSV